MNITRFLLFRMAVEKEMEKGGPLARCNLLFDESGFFLMYATLLGIKVVNLHTNKLVRTLGRPENLRLLFLAIFQVSNSGGYLNLILNNKATIRMCFMFIQFFCHYGAKWAKSA